MAKGQSKKIMQCIRRIRVMIAFTLCFTVSSVLGVTHLTFPVSASLKNSDAIPYLQTYIQNHLDDFQRLKKTEHHAAIFVSFSLPEKLLVSLLKTGTQCHIPVVMRGLVQNSFKKTVKRIFNLSKTYSVDGVLIDPLWFRTFQIDRVPALVVSQKAFETEDIAPQDFDVVYGNGSIEDSLRLMVNEADSVHPIAEKLLACVIGEGSQ